MKYTTLTTDGIQTIEFLFNTNPASYAIKINGEFLLRIEAVQLWDMLKEDLSKMSGISNLREERRRFEARAALLSTNLYLTEKGEN